MQKHHFCWIFAEILIHIENSSQIVLLDVVQKVSAGTNALTSTLRYLILHVRKRERSELQGVSSVAVVGEHM